MLQVDSEINTQIRQRFHNNCIELTNRIEELQTKNKELSLRILALIEKRKKLRDKILLSSIINENPNISQ